MGWLVLLVGLSAFVFVVQGEDITSIIGDVTSREARVLYWSFNIGEERRDSVFCSLSLTPPAPSMAVHVLEVTATPKVVELWGLLPGQQYRLNFHCGESTQDGSELHYSHFHTLAEDPSPTSGKMYFFSCNRLAEGEDNTMWHMLQKEISTAPHQPITLFHLGDQVYADQISQMVEERRKSESCITYRDILHEFRNIYARTWNTTAMQAVLRRNSHRMLLDDHDVVNNFNSIKWNENDPWRKALLRAGMQAFLEYQQQLVSDIPSFDFVVHAKEASCCLGESIDKDLPVCESLEWQEFDEKLKELRLWNTNVVGNVATIVLDTRGERVFHDEVTLFGREQLSFLEENLRKYDRDDSIHSILVISSIPIIYQSSFMAEIAFLGEGEKYSTHQDLQESTGSLLDILFRYPKKVSIVGGDIHMHLNASICRAEDNLCIRQRITSGMHHKSSTIRSIHLYLYAFFAVQVFTPYIYTASSTYYLSLENVFLDNNFIEFSYDTLQTNWRVLQRQIESPLFEKLQILFENPFAYYFIICCLISNMIFIVFVCYILTYRKSRPNKIKKE